MHTIDWILVFAPLLLVLGIGIFTQSYMRSVADFMSGGRVAGRYLLAVARGEMAAGAGGVRGGIRDHFQGGFYLGVVVVDQHPGWANGGDHGVCCLPLPRDPGHDAGAVF